MRDRRLLFVLRVRRFTWLGRVDEQVHSDLTGHGWAEGDGRHLVDLVDDLFVDIDQLEIPPSTTTLARYTLAE